MKKILQVSYALLASLSVNFVFANTNNVGDSDPISVNMSPDGQFATIIGSMGAYDERGFAVVDLNTFKARLYSWVEGQELHDCEWIDKYSLIFTVFDRDKETWRLFSFNRAYDRYSRIFGMNDDIIIVNAMPENERFYWVWNDTKSYLAKFRKGGTMYNTGGSLDTESGDVRLIRNRIYLPKGEMIEWLFDKEDNPAMVLIAEDGNYAYHQLDSDKVWSVLDINANQWRIQSLVSDDTALVIGLSGEATEGLYSYNLTSKRVGQLIFRDPEINFSANATYKYYNGKLVGIHYGENSLKSHWFSNEFAQIERMVNNKLSDTQNVIHEWDTDLSKLIVHAYDEEADSVQYKLVNLVFDVGKHVIGSVSTIEFETQPLNTYQSIATVAK